MFTFFTVSMVSNHGHINGIRETRDINLNCVLVESWGPPRFKIWGVQVNCNYKVAVTGMYVYGLEVSTWPDRMRAWLGSGRIFFNRAGPTRFGPGRTIS